MIAGNITVFGGCLMKLDIATKLGQVSRDIETSRVSDHLAMIIETIFTLGVEDTVKSRFIRWGINILDF